MARKSRQDRYKEIIEEAKERFQMAEDWEADCRVSARADQRFVWGDSHNNYQWDSAASAARQAAQKPMLTINRTSVLCDAIVNEIKTNPPQINVVPTGDRASAEGAQVMLGLIKHIEYISNARNIYKDVAEQTVHNGWGYWRLITDYCDDDSFDQEIKMQWIQDPFSVYLDPQCEDRSGYGAQWGFIFSEIPIKEFERLYPKVRLKNNDWGQRTWVRQKDKVARIAEYFRRVPVETRLIMFSTENGVDTIREDILSKNQDAYDQIMADPSTQTRPLTYYEVEWYKIAGDEIVEEGDWIGDMIPIVRCCAKQAVIDGKLNRKGHVRNLKDPQKMYNYWTSSAAETISYQSKAPWIAPAKAIENYQQYWAVAGTNPPAVLPYNHIDDKGNPIPAPIKSQGPEMPSAYIAGMAAAAEEIRMVSGQPKADLGDVDDSRSGVAVKRVQQASELCTAHYQDALDDAVQATGRMIVSMIPKIYDTKRTLKIMGESMKPTQVDIDPAYKQEWTVHEQNDIGRVALIFNPGFAKYEVQVKSGPGYATRREQAAELMAPLLGNPQFMSLAGDLAFSAMDFEYADEVADRFRRSLPPGIIDGGIPPQIAQAMQEKDAMIKALQDQVAALATESRRDYLEKKEQQLNKQLDAMQKQIDAYRAITDRLKVMQPATPVDEQIILAEQTVEAAASAPLG